MGKLLGVTDSQVEDLAFPASTNAPVDEDGSDVILCESSARAKVVAEAAKAAELPFVRFEVLLVEGKLQISGDTCRPCQHKFLMDPAFISIGDCGNILGLGSVSSEWKGGGTWWEADKTEHGIRHPANPRLYNLQAILKPNVDTMEVMKYVFGDCDGEVEDEDINQLVEEPAFEAQEHPDVADSFFHLNREGQTSFTPQQAANT